MAYDTEKLRERLLDLEQSRKRERKLRKEAEALLEGLLPLGKARDTAEIFSVLADVLHDLLTFDQAFLLVKDGDEFRSVAATDMELMEIVWKPQLLFERVLAGEPISVFDVAYVPEWQQLPPDISQQACSALLVPLRSLQPPALLVCTHQNRGAFDQDDLVLARRVGAFAAQALRNIEQQHEALRQAAREREQQVGFRLLLEHSPDAIWMSGEDGIEYVNPALQTLLEYQENDLIGMNAIDLIFPDDRSIYRESFMGLERPGQSTSAQELRLCSSTGKTIFLELVGLYLRVEEKKTLICLGRDISGRKELTARLMQMDRMVAAGTLAAGVGHEINNPLSFVLANLDFSVRAVTKIEKFINHGVADLNHSERGEVKYLIDELLDSLDSAHHGGKRIASIVKELRSFSKGAYEIEAGPVALLPLLESARKTARSQLSDRARYIEDIQPVPCVRGTRAHLAQVLVNLMRNAAQAIEPGKPDENEIQVSVYQEADFVIVEIRDTGRGIHAEHLEHIFDPFFTTKPPDEGTGLGLSISQQNIISFGGNISFETELGVGTTFKVSLAIEDEDLPITEPTYSLIDDTEVTIRPRILVIDDEEEVGLGLRRLLRNDAELTLVTRPQRAQELLKQGCVFDIILCDLVMPQITGIEFYKYLQRNHSEYLERVIFISGGLLMDDAHDFLGNIDNRCIFKPFSRVELMQEVKQITGRFVAD